MIIYYNNTKHTKKHGQDFSHDDFCPAPTKLALDLHVKNCPAVRLSGCPVVFSKLLIGGPTCFWQWFWHRDVDIEVIEVAQLEEKKKKC